MAPVVKSEFNLKECHVLLDRVKSIDQMARQKLQKIKSDQLYNGSSSSQNFTSSEVVDLCDDGDDEDDDDNISDFDTCKICKEGGCLVCCDYCPRAYHPNCLTPPMEIIPTGFWACLFCSCSPIKNGQVKLILTWRWAKEETEEYKQKYSKTPIDKRQLLAVPQKEFFVHLREKSYWECEWVTNEQLFVFHPLILRPIDNRLKYDTVEPPTLEYFEDDDDDDNGYLTTHEKMQLYQKYYQYGVNPAFLKIDRIINHKKGPSKRNHEGEKEKVILYLVKWKSLNYEHCTWESATSLSFILKEFTRQVEIYYEFRHYFLFTKYKNRRENGGEFIYRHIQVNPPTRTGNLTYKFPYGQGLSFISSQLNLYDYQIDGLNWLRYSWKNKTNTILADEMGLGKTIQCLTFFYSLYMQGFCTGPFLVAAPLTTIINWEREAKLWAPNFYVVTYTGLQDNRKVIREHELTGDPSGSRRLASKQLCSVKGDVKFHLMLTSYEFINKEATVLRSIPWEIICIDEAHRLKTESSVFFRSLTTYQTKYKLLLTGTPLQNNLTELYNLLHFLVPEKFNDLEQFLEDFSDINKSEQVSGLHDILGPHMLRRLKADVLTLPSKTELLIRVELTKMQKDYYKFILTKNFEALNKKGGRQASLNWIVVDLRKCCNHPYLFSTAAMSAPVVYEGTDDERYELETLTDSSGKLILLRKMLHKLKEQGHRVLIFSYSTTLLDILEDFLNGLEYQYERIDGSVHGIDRQMSIDRFNDPKSKSFVFLLSAKAGGLGINLATADTVIIYDSDWNPHNDLQALSRAHRIGQKNKVMVYRFVTRKTIEERIAQVAKTKLTLNQVVVESNRGIKGGKISFSKQELEKILQFGAADLFKEEDDTAVIHYTDEVIEKLLDRDQYKDDDEQGDGNNEEIKDVWINDYLKSFKVAQYVNAVSDDHDMDTEEVVVEPPQVQVEEEVYENVYANVEEDLTLPKIDDDESDEEEDENMDPQDFWRNLLHADWTVLQEAQEKQNALLYGRGKRQSFYRRAYQDPIRSRTEWDIYDRVKFKLTPELLRITREFTNQTVLSRSNINKMIRLYVDRHQSYNPDDKTGWVICDEALILVLGVKTFKILDLYHHLDPHLVGHEAEDSKMDTPPKQQELLSKIFQGQNNSLSTGNERPRQMESLFSHGFTSSHIDELLDQAVGKIPKLPLRFQPVQDKQVVFIDLADDDDSCSSVSLIEPRDPLAW